MKKNILIKPNKSLSNFQILFFLLITGFLIMFIGVRFILVGAWPIILFGIAEFSILVICTYLFYNNSKKGEKITLDESKIILNKTNEDLEETVLEQNIVWSKIQSEKDSLSINYSGNKTFFAKFLSEKRREKLKNLLNRYKSRFQ